MIRKFKLILVFFKRLMVFNFLFSIAALLVFVSRPSLDVLALLFWSKIVGYGFVLYVFYKYRKNELYFYHNQELSGFTLFFVSFFIDAFIFCILFLILYFLLLQ